MNVFIRIGVAALAAAPLLLPTPAWADSSNGADTMIYRSETSQMDAVFETVDPTDGCIQNYLVIHGWLELGSMSAVVQRGNACTGANLLQTSGYTSGDITIDASLQNGHAAGTIITTDRSNPEIQVPVTFDLNWSGTGALITTAAAPGLAPNSTGFHLNTKWFEVTSTGVLSLRPATISGSVDIPGFTFPMSSAQSPDLSKGRLEFIVTFKPVRA